MRSILYNFGENWKSGENSDVRKGEGSIRRYPDRYMVMFASYFEGWFELKKIDSSLGEVLYFCLQNRRTTMTC